MRFLLVLLLVLTTGSTLAAQQVTDFGGFGVRSEIVGAGGQIYFFAEDSPDSGKGELWQFSPTTFEVSLAIDFSGPDVTRVTGIVGLERWVYAIPDDSAGPNSLMEYDTATGTARAILPNASSPPEQTVRTVGEAGAGIHMQVFAPSTGTQVYHYAPGTETLTLVENPDAAAQPVTGLGFAGPGDLTFFVYSATATVPTSLWAFDVSLGTFVDLTPGYDVVASRPTAERLLANDQEVVVQARPLGGIYGLVHVWLETGALRYFDNPISTPSNSFLAMQGRDMLVYDTSAKSLYRFGFDGVEAGGDLAIDVLADDDSPNRIGVPFGPTVYDCRVMLVVRRTGGGGVFAPRDVFSVPLPDCTSDGVDLAALSGELQLSRGYLVYEGGLYATRGDGTNGVELFVAGVVAPAPVHTESDPADDILGWVAPNPVSGRATLRVTPAAPGPLRATLADALGREVRVLWDQPVQGTTDIPVDASGLAPGIYHVRVHGSFGLASRPFVVVR